MTSVGNRLRGERVRQGLKLSEIAERLCIAEKNLRAIETDDVKGVPGGFFYRSFVRQYAAALGVAEKEYGAELEKLLAAEAPLPLPGQDPNFPVRRSDPILYPASRYPANQRSSRPRVGWSAAALGAVLFACSGFYVWWNKTTGQTVSAAVMQAPPPLRPPSPPLGSQVSALTDPTQPGAPPAADANSTDSSFAVSDSVKQVVLNLSAKEETWLSLVSDGKETFSGVLEPGQTKTLKGVEVALLRLANASGLDVLWNGKSVGPIGPHGQMRVVVFKPDNFEILPAAALAPVNP